MAADSDSGQWLTKSNDAFQISLVVPSDDNLKSVATFYPQFTYPLFGEDEQIFGYQGLRMNLRFRANDMRPHFKMSSSKTYKGDDEREPVNVRAVLEDGGHLPKIAFVKEVDFLDSAKQMSNTWTPPGKLHSSFQGPDGTYEIWQGTLDDPAVKQLISRVQILNTLYIEGGSYIGQVVDHESGTVTFDYSDADRWTVFFLYRKQPSSAGQGEETYTFAGFSTIYRFYYFSVPTPPASPKGDWELPKDGIDFSQLPCRTRLSQFVVLPPFQHKGLGARLYKAIFKHYHEHSQTQQLTIEDPNEAFDDLRDACDLTFLRSIPEFNSLKLDTKVTIPKSGPVPKLVVGGEAIPAIQTKSKIAPRQFARVLEMHLMSQLPSAVQMSMTLDEKPPATQAEKHQHKLWQLFTKQRLYRQNRDVLSQMEMGERVEKLAETLVSVELEYARLLAAYERVKKHEAASDAPVANGNGKRKLDGDEIGEAGFSSKKARVEEV